MRKLSAYTIASNCTDIQDIQIGINELKIYFLEHQNPVKLHI
jgi:hypothetical protein